MRRIPIWRAVLACLVVIAAVGVALYFTGILGCQIPKTRIATRQLNRSGAATTLPAPAEEWPRWRGPRTDQISRETGLLEKWPAEGPAVVWSADVGLGFASPIAHQGRVYCFSLNELKETLTAFAAATGQILWSVEGREGWTSSYVGTRATPTIDGDRIYTFGGQGDLTCRRLADGKELWFYNVLENGGGGNISWGCSSTPLVDESRIYVQGGKSGPVAFALDKLSGKIAWKSQATGVSGYAHPILANVAGTPQLIVFAGEAIYGMNPQTGATLWSHPWNTSYDVNASTPLYDPATARLLVTSAYGHGSIQLQLSPGSAQRLWENKSIESRFQGAILDNGVLYANSEGTIVCVSWLDGSTRWRAADSSLRLGAGGTLVRAGDQLIALSERGKLSLVGATPAGITLRSSAKVLEGTQIWATPLLYAGRLYVKGAQELVCYDVTGK